MDAAVAGHVLAQVLHAGVHQLHGVQGAAAVLGVARRVGGDAVELVEHLDAGVVRAGDDLVHVARVPGQGAVELAPHALASHEGLACAALLAGAAVEDDRAAVAGLFEEVPDGEGRAQRARAEHVVAAAVAGSALDKRLMLSAAGGLAESGEGVKLAQDADYRPSGAVPAAKGGFHAGEALRDLEAVLAQGVTVEPGALELL